MDAAGDAPLYAELAAEKAWHDLLHGHDVTRARLFYASDTYCAGCDGYFPRTAEYWTVLGADPHTLGYGLCLWCVEKISNP